MPFIITTFTDSNPCLVPEVRDSLSLLEVGISETVLAVNTMIE
jgi:hypothetical protein